MIIKIQLFDATGAWRDLAGDINLTHWGRDKTDVISQTTFSTAFPWLKIFEIRLKLKLKCVPTGSINNIPALVRIMAWRRPGDKPLSEAMLVSLQTHKCVTKPQWVNRRLKKRGFCCLLIKSMCTKTESSTPVMHFLKVIYFFTNKWHFS